MSCVTSPPANCTFRPFLEKSGYMAALQRVSCLALSAESNYIFPHLFAGETASLLQQRSLITCAVAATWCFILESLLLLLEKIFRAISGLRKAATFDQFSFRSFWGEKYNRKTCYYLPSFLFYFVQIPYFMMTLFGFICILAVWGSISVVVYVFLLEACYFVACNSLYSMPSLIWEFLSTVPLFLPPR